MKRKVLITGASGFVGKKLAEELCRNKEIALSVLVRKKESVAEFSGKDISIFEGDITKPDTLKKSLGGQDAVVHCAALMSDFDDRSKKEFYLVNAAGTKNVIDSCDRSLLKHFIHISTAGVYGTTGDKPVNEDTPYGCVLSAYEWSKKEAENIVKSCNGLVFTILRPSQLYGEGMEYGWPDTIRSIKSGNMAVPGNGDASIHLLHVDDLVEALKTALFNSKAIGRIYNIAGPEIMKIKEVFDLISDGLDVKRPKKVPYRAVYAAALCLSMMPVWMKTRKMRLLSPHRVRFFAMNHSYDTSRVLAELGYKAEIRVNDGIKRMLDWCEKGGFCS